MKGQSLWAKQHQNKETFFVFELDHWLFYFHILMCYRVISHTYAATYAQRHTKESLNSALTLKLGRGHWF